MSTNEKSVLHYQAGELFYKQRKKGRLLGVIPRSSPKYRLPSLEKLLKILPSTGETDLGLLDIPLNRIIGSENRSEDFVGDFLPRKEWMEERWVKVMVHMLSPEGFDAVQLIEYGGYYFIRDGNHRVSIAKALKMEFISAHVRRFDTSLRLPVPFDYGHIHLWKEQVAVHNRRDLFRHMDPDLFDIRRAGSWCGLEKSLFKKSLPWFSKKYGRPPESPEELMDSWQKNIFGPTMVFIEENSLHYLLPGWGSTDIFLDFCRFWEKQPGGGELWLEEIYRLYAAGLYRKRFLLILLQLGAKALRSLAEDKDDALERFRQVTRQKEFIPEFELPSCTKKLIRYLYRQVYFSYALFLKKKFGRAPYIGELTLHWYRNFYTPLYRHFTTLHCQRSFPAYYIVFSRRYFTEFEQNPDGLSAFMTEYCRTCPIRDQHVS